MKLYSEPHIRNQKYYAILYIVLAALSFSMVNVFVRLAGDMPTMQKGFLRNAVVFLVSGMVLLKKRQRPYVKKGSRGTLFLRSLCGTIGIIFNFYAVDHLVLSDASMLNKMSPFFAIFFSFLVLKERLTPFQALAVALAFFGSMLIVKPTFANMELTASLGGFFGGVAAGAAYMLVRKLGSEGVSGPVIVFYFSGIACLLTLPFLLFGLAPITGMQVLWMIAAGIASSCGQFAITAAYCRAPAREISVYDYSQVLFSAGLGFLLFGQLPDAWSVVGYIIIIGVAVLMFLHNTQGLFQTKKH